MCFVFSFSAEILIQVQFNDVMLVSGAQDNDSAIVYINCPESDILKLLIMPRLFARSGEGESGGINLRQCHKLVSIIYNVPDAVQ